MRVIRAKAMGMCFGVKDALAAAAEVQNPRDVTIHGELVHNPEVNRRLAGAGYRVSGEVGREIPATPAVMITAHGVSNRERQKLEAAGKQIIDTTCPLVRRAHDVALRIAQAGWHVVVAGKKGHVEVIGLTGDLTDYTIVENPEQAHQLDHDRLGIVCQTTLQPAAAEAITTAIQVANPYSEVRLFDTICRPTRERQKAMEDLVHQCDALVVVGGEHSNNTNQLVRLAESEGKPARRINSANELDVIWAAGFQVIGLSAGTSTPDDIIEAVYQKLLAVSPAKMLAPLSRAS